MSDSNGTEAIFIQEAILLPATHSIKSEKFLPGWRVVKNLDSDALARTIEDADWHSFYLAGEIRATVFGLNRPGTFRRAVKSVLAKRRLQKFAWKERESFRNGFSVFLRQHNRPFPPYSARLWTCTCQGFCLANPYCPERRSCRPAIR